VSSDPNETVRLLLERASCRSFSGKKVPDEVLRLVLQAGIHAPTAGNLQPFSIIKIEEAETKEKIAELCSNQSFIGEAPVLLLFCIDWHRNERWAELESAPFTATSAFRHFWTSFQDVIICAQNICTAADSVGLGSVYIGSVLECFRELHDLLRLPRGVFPVVLLCLGYPKTKPVPQKKLSVDVVVHSEGYRELTDQELLGAFRDKYGGTRRDRLEATEERLKTIYEVCREVHGEEFAQKCIDRIKKQGYISAVQNYFGLHYRANRMPKGNDAYLKMMKEFGFNWFEKHKPLKEKAA